MYNNKEKDVLYSLGLNSTFEPKEFSLQYDEVSISCFKWGEGRYELSYDNPSETGEDASYAVPFTKFDDMIDYLNEILICIKEI
jgi:hypothetical protein